MLEKQRLATGLDSNEVTHWEEQELVKEEQEVALSAKQKREQARRRQVQERAKLFMLLCEYNSSNNPMPMNGADENAGSGGSGGGGGIGNTSLLFSTHEVFLARDSRILAGEHTRSNHGQITVVTSSKYCLQASVIYVLVIRVLFSCNVYA